MRFMNFFDKKKRSAVIVQCRLSSTRLPRKALLPLGGKTVLEWTLAAMKKVNADRYYLATDVESGPELEAITKKCGYEFFAGSKEDVLDRFVKTITLAEADVVVRATADNPFLFYEAAQALLDEYKDRESSSPVDYITWTGLPHGSGVEVFNAHSLLKAATETTDAYDHEHVGPALYKHTDKYKCVFLHAPKEFFYPALRTTIDVYGDYRRARAVVQSVLTDNPDVRLPVKEPFNTKQIVAALEKDFVKYPTLLVPSVQKGHGTGHLRRCLELAVKTKADIYIDPAADLGPAGSLIEAAKEQGLCDFQIVNDITHADFYNLAVTDLFVSDKNFITELASKCPVAAIDEGAAETNYADYLLDIIPGIDTERKVNLTDASFIPMPENRRQDVNYAAPLKTALVVLGGEDPASLTLPAAKALASCGLSVTAVLPQSAGVNSEADAGITVSGAIENLKEKLYQYDLIVTHYGFTAFEAVSAGCAVILLGTSPLHEKLADMYGFAWLGANNVTAAAFKNLLEKPESLYKKQLAGADSEGGGNGKRSLAQFVTILSKGKQIPCPVCGKKDGKKDAVVARTAARTFRRCSCCGMIYMSWTLTEKPTEYNRAYFYEDYQKQYGKTYEEDFASIKAQGVRRMSVIDSIYNRRHSSITPTILDVGCALGPFMDAANDSGWQVFGIDVSPDAVSHVTHKLHYPALCGSFPETDVTGQFGIDRYDAITMWYVIEHFQNLDDVLKGVSSLLKKGGIFAFSTPSAAGVSAKYNTQKFYEQSPADHYTLWEPARAQAILRKYGFEVKKIVSTGLHPERFPDKMRKYGNGALNFMSRTFKLGDTFEIYCRKEV